MREDPDREGLLYAGTEFGMFISFDNGAHWQSFQLNLPHVPITDIKVHHKDLVVATQGRAFWILDNISSLHQLARSSTAADVHLFKPRDGYRTRIAPAILGPHIEYYLPVRASRPGHDRDPRCFRSLVASYNSDAVGRRWTRRAGTRCGSRGRSDDPDAAPASAEGGAPSSHGSRKLRASIASSGTCGIRRGFRCRRVRIRRASRSAL